MDGRHRLYYSTSKRQNDNTRQHDFACTRPDFGVPTSNCEANRRASSSLHRLRGSPSLVRLHAERTRPKNTCPMASRWSSLKFKTSRSLDTLAKTCDFCKTVHLYHIQRGSPVHQALGGCSRAIYRLYLDWRSIHSFQRVVKVYESR